MSRDASPPFGRGEYEETSGVFDYLVGKEYVFEDLDYSAASTNVGAKPARSGKSVTVRLVKNNSGGVLLPKRLVQFSTTAGPDQNGAVVTGYTTTTAARGFPVDEFVPSGGVPNGAYFYVVVRGPAKVLTDIAAVEGNVIAVGDPVVALTAATSGATTAGRVSIQSITGTTATALINQIQNLVGRALTASTTGYTNSDLLVEVGRIA